jgi:hypothetical protein
MGRGPRVLGRDDRRPGILALSAPAVSDDGKIALLYAVLRARRVSDPGHVAAQALILLARDGPRWTVRQEIDVDAAPRAR